MTTNTPESFDKRCRKEFERVCWEAPQNHLWSVWITAAKWARDELAKKQGEPDGIVAIHNGVPIGETLLHHEIPDGVYEFYIIHTPDAHTDASGDCSGDVGITKEGNKPIPFHWENTGGYAQMPPGAPLPEPPQQSAGFEEWWELCGGGHDWKQICKEAYAAGVASKDARVKELEEASDYDHEEYKRLRNAQTKKLEVALVALQELDKISRHNMSTYGQWIVKLVTEALEKIGEK